ncbi:MAG: hypothetical protein ACPGKS_05975 [Coraliomargarita sp.]
MEPALQVETILQARNSTTPETGEFRDGSGVILGKYRKVLIIRINHSYAGLFAYFIFALNQLRYCEKHNYLPVIYFGEDSKDGKNAYYDPEQGDNMWDYYFEPVSSLSYSQLMEMVHSPDNPLCEEDIIQLSSRELTYLHMHARDSIYGYPYGYYKLMTQYDADWFLRQRNEARRVVDKYVRVKSHVLDVVNAFEQQFMAGHAILGIHMRGTDKGAADASSATNRKIVPEEYFEETDRYLNQHPECKIFVATDQAQYLEVMKARYGERIIHFDAQRSRDNLNIFQKQSEGNAYKKGEEALVDCLLLARCSFLLKCTSHLSETAMYFNRQLECIDMNYLATR